MFRQPRKTLCSDSRFTLEALHDRIIERLGPDRQAAYLLHVADFFQHADFSETKRGQTFQAFAQLVEPYLTDPERSRITVNLIDTTTDACRECGCVRYVSEPGFVTCTECGVQRPHQDLTRGALNFNDPREEAHTYPYRRSNHFQEWLTQSQAKQSTVIPDEVMDAIHAEMRKRRLAPGAVDAQKLKSITKELRLNKYYEHIPYLLYKITGKAPFQISAHDEERMKHMFAQIQAPFERVLPSVAPQRRNMLSYAFVLRKFAELLELDDVAASFPLLKSREKLGVQDRIWKAICEELDWRFIPSL